VLGDQSIKSERFKYVAIWLKLLYMETF